VRRAIAIGASTCILLGGATGALFGTTTAGADTVGANFEAPGYTTGTINGQNGWSKTGAYDVAVVANSGFPAAPAGFGAQSLRASNATVSGAFGDQTFSRPTSDAAGETAADTGGFPVGTLRSTFTAEFDFASATGASQSPLIMSVSPDRGDGARMSYVRIEDDGSSWDLFFDDYKDNAPLGSGGNLDDGCGGEDEFAETAIGSYSLSQPHTVRFEMKFVNGPHNDVVKVYVDGALKITGTTWEDYFRYCAESGGGTGGSLADQSRIVRRLLFRFAGTANLANSGQGFLIDNLDEQSATPPPPATAPGAPQMVTAKPGNGKAAVSWKPPASNGGSSINGYVVTPIKAGTPQAPITFNSTATTQVITGLTNTVNYKFNVSAKNAVGTGPSASSNGGVRVGAPGMPLQPTVNKPASGSLKVKFKAPAPNGSPITGYTAKCTSGNGGAAGSKNGGKSPITVTGLTAGKTYRCRVLARNARGDGSPSLPSAALTA
jgi:hypothetical protein